MSGLLRSFEELKLDLVLPRCVPELVREGLEEILRDQFFILDQNLSIGSDEVSQIHSLLLQPVSGMGHKESLLGGYHAHLGLSE